MLVCVHTHCHFEGASVGGLVWTLPPFPLQMFCLLLSEWNESLIRSFLTHFFLTGQTWRTTVHVCNKHGDRVSSHLYPMARIFANLRWAAKHGAGLDRPEANFGDL